MPSKSAKFLYRTVPRRRIGLRPVLWLIVGFSLLTTLSASWVVFALSGKIDSHHNFVGQLSPDSDPIIVVLPKGGILKELHVARSEKVTRNQTVATLDVEAMQRRVDELGAAVLHDNILRECLLIEELPDTAYFVDLPEMERDHARLAKQDCQSFFNEKSQLLQQALSDRASMHEERILIERYIGLLSTGLRQDIEPRKREDDARQVLALGLLRNKLDRQIATLEFSADKGGAEWQKQRLERVKKLGDSIRRNTTQRDRMRNLLERPRLQVPESGFVVQVRNVQRDTAMHEDIDLLVLRPESGTGYNASFEVPHHRLDAVATGNKVQMTMLGMLNGGPVLTGEVSALKTTGQTAVRATITLDNESIARLDNPKIGIALRGLGTASIIRVEKTGVTAVQILEQILNEKLLFRREDWFINRLLTPATSL